MTIEIYSDVACPWCYVGERRFMRALAALPASVDVDVSFRPFQLDPTLPDTPSPLRAQLERKFGPRVESILRSTASTAAGEGIDLQFDRALAVNTLTAHRVLRLALLEYGADVQHTLAEALFKAHFTDGRNVADAGVLTELAAEAGMDRERVAAYLASDEGLNEVRAEIAEAQQLGIQAVPTFVFDGRFAVQGAQPTSTFVQVLEEVLGQADEQTDPADEDAACADGSCATGY